MTVYVLKNSKLVEKDSIADALQDRRSFFPTPMISRIEPFESPITGKTISSWRQRDADMRAADAVDPRDLPREPFEERIRKNARRPDEGDAFQWRDGT
jgi:hypothetical protein